MKKNTNKLLIIAYACEPNKGSEPAVGWNISLELSKYYDVYVTTRTNNKEVIEKEYLPENIHFIYVDVPKRFLKIKKYLGIPIYYFIWQFLVIVKLNKLNIMFDLTYLLTFGNLLYPNLFSLFFRPIIWGPVGFGYSTPLGYWKYYSNYGKFNEALRFIIEKINRINPLLYIAIKRTDLIFTVSNISQDYVKRIYKKANVRILSQVGISNMIKEFLVRQPGKSKLPKSFQNNDSSFTILMAGRLVHWKGFAIAIFAFSELIKTVTTARMIIIGNGYELTFINKLIRKFSLENYIFLYPQMNYYEYLEVLKTIDVFIYPSLHEPGAFVLAEALYAGKNIACFKYGEPDIIVPEQNNVKIDISSDYHGFVIGLLKLYDIRKINKDFSGASNFGLSWAEKTNIIFEEIRKILNENSPSS